MASKNEAIKAKLRKLYEESNEKNRKNKSKVEELKTSGFNDNCGGEKEQLQNTLNQISEKIDDAQKKFDEAFINENRIITSTEEFDEFDVLLRFRDSCDLFKTKLKKIENSLKKLEKNNKMTAEAVLARNLRDISLELGNLLETESAGDRQIFKIPLQEIHLQERDKLRRFEYGMYRPEKDHRIILLAGMTGSGKSLLLNNMINYIYGVRYEDNFRFKLIVESEEIEERDGNSSDEAASMTSYISSYTFHWQEGFCIDFSITIIDTPGFGDTRGLAYDQKIVDQMRLFFHNEFLCPNQELTCVGFVIQASQARFTVEQTYIFNQVLSLFGKDIAENIFINLTFADAEESPALKVIKTAQIPFAEGCTFKFNNSALYASNKGTDANRIAWEFGYENLKQYFIALKKTNHRSLKLTKEVLHTREKLRLILSNLQGKISNGMDTLRQIENQIDIITRLDGTIKANRDYKVKKQLFKCELVDSDLPMTNCKICCTTCHTPCDVKGDRKKACASMDEEGNCEICEGKCFYTDHINGTHIYTYTSIEVEETIEEMLKKYDVTLGEKNDKKNLLQKLHDKYKVQKCDLMDSITKANEYYNQLEAIALRPNNLNNVQYIERLIDMEEKSSLPNKTNRIKQLRHFQELAEMLAGARGNESLNNSLILTVSDYETEIAKRIENMADDVEK